MIGNVFFDADGGGSSFEQMPFLVNGETSFGPFYPPDRIQIEKERDLKRESSMCGGEDVTDNGSKNREIHVSGVIRKSEVSAFNNLIDEDEALDLITVGFQGEVHVRKGDFEGPTTWDPEHKEWMYKYTVDFVSTGRDDEDKAQTIVSGPDNESFGYDYSVPQTSDYE